jgi:hypothetical protein
MGWDAGRSLSSARSRQQIYETGVLSIAANHQPAAPRYGRRAQKKEGKRDQCAAAIKPLANDIYSLLRDHRKWLRPDALIRLAKFYALTATRRSSDGRSFRPSKPRSRLGKTPATLRKKKPQHAGLTRWHSITSSALLLACNIKLGARRSAGSHRDRCHLACHQDSLIQTGPLLCPTLRKDRRIIGSSGPTSGTLKRPSWLDGRSSPTTG